MTMKIVESKRNAKVIEFVKIIQSVTNTSVNIMGDVNKPVHERIIVGCCASSNEIQYCTTI